MPSPRGRYRSVSGDRQRRRRYPWPGRGGPLLAEVLSATCRLVGPRPCTPRPRKAIPMPVTTTDVAVVLNGLPDRDDPDAVEVTVRCPHCGDRHVWASGCSLRRGRWVLGDRSQRQGGGGHAPARQARSVEPSPRRASELTACSGSRTHLVDHVHPRVDWWPTIPLKPAARDRPRCGECRACRDCAGCL